MLKNEVKCEKNILLMQKLLKLFIRFVPNFLIIQTQQEGFNGNIKKFFFKQHNTKTRIQESQAVEKLMTLIAF